MSDPLSALPLHQLEVFVEDAIWLVVYPVRFLGMDLSARTTLIRLADGSLLAHSPGSLTPELVERIRALGPLRHVVALGTFHWLHVDDYRAEWPEAKVSVFPGIEERAPDLAFDQVLGDEAPDGWVGELEQVVVRGTRSIREVAFFHPEIATLVLTDLIENVGDETEGVDWKLKMWWKVVFRMWNHPKPAPEYQLGWKDKEAARRSLERILEWDFERIVLAHGDNVEEHAKELARRAWAKPLSFSSRG